MSIHDLTSIPKIGKIGGLDEIAAPQEVPKSAPRFSEALKEAVQSVDELQKSSEAAQVSYARGDEVELHDVLIKIEEADLAFRTMMEVRNKLVDAYREVMRLGSGG